MFSSKTLIGSFVVVWIAFAVSPAFAQSGTVSRVGAATSTTGKSSNQKILLAANDSVGKKMWFGYGLPNGRLGCAAALSNVLKKAGYPVAKSAAVVVVRRQLLNSSLNAKETAVKHSKDSGVDLKKLREISQPGDLIFGYMTTPDKPNMGPDAHCGVVAENGEVFANDWNDGIWKRAEADRFFGFYPHIYVMRFGNRASYQ